MRPQASLSLCEACTLMRPIISGRRSRFLLCEHSQRDPRYPKYPAQPKLACRAFIPRDAIAEGSPDDQHSTDPP